MPINKGHIWGKLIFGLVFSIKGWLWGLVGVALGHVFIDRKRSGNVEGDEAFAKYRRKQGRFVYHVFTLCAKMAKAKGAVGRPEILFMEKLMQSQFRMPKSAREDAVKIWKRSKDSDIVFERLAHAFFSEFRTERHQVYTMMDLLLGVSAADGRLHPQQEQLLLRAAAIFQISRLQYNRIKQRYFYVQAAPAWKPLDPHYSILGANPSDSLESIKKKYRKLVMKYHPDKTIAAGALEAQIKHTQKKFQEVQEAYEAILAARQI